MEIKLETILAQNKFNYDLDAVKQLAEVLVQHDLSEIEYSKDISKDQKIHIKIAKSLELNTASSKEKIKEVSEKIADTNIEEVEKPTGDEIYNAQISDGRYSLSIP